MVKTVRETMSRIATQERNDEEVVVGGTYLAVLYCSQIREVA